MIKTANDVGSANDDDDDEGRSAYCRLMRIADPGQSVAHENQDDDDEEEDDDEDDGKEDDEEEQHTSQINLYKYLLRYIKLFFS